MRSTDGKAELLFRAFNTDPTEIRKKEKIVSKMTANDGQKQTFSSTEKQEKEKIRRDRMDKCEREKKMEFSGPALYEQGEEIR